jgi:hypothetical protein
LRRVSAIAAALAICWNPRIGWSVDSTVTVVLAEAEEVQDCLLGEA